MTKTKKNSSESPIFVCEALSRNFAKNILAKVFRAPGLSRLLDRQKPMSEMLIIIDTTKNET